MAGQGEILNNTFYVYAHFRNDTGQIFYVGKGRAKRARKSDGRNIYWKRIVEKAGGFTVEYLEKNLTEQRAFEMEIFYIKKFRDEGKVICNLTDGGEGSSGIIPTEEHKRKVSEAKKGVKRHPDVVSAIALAKTIPMVGFKFGRLLVLKENGISQSGRHKKYLCECDCGKNVVRGSNTLRNGRDPSCGCSARENQRKINDITGRKFGRLLAISCLPDSDKKRNILWNCVCDCGGSVIATADSLKSSHTRSCGCLYVETRRKKNVE